MPNFLTSGGDLLNISPLTAVINIAMAFALSLVIAWVYKKTHRGLSYSQSFVFTLVIMGTLVSVVMMIIGNSVARAFTLLGSFTIIRFRSAIKDTKDMAFIFWALVTGLAIGTENYIIAIITTALVIGIVLILSKFNFGSIRSYDHILTFSIEGENVPTDVYLPVFNKYLSSQNLLNVNTKEDSKRMNFTFSVKLIEDDGTNNFVADLRATAGIKNVNLISSREDIEY
jgi:uncharacterized membrane protein YhiD involved in acid resistance